MSKETVVITEASWVQSIQSLVFSLGENIAFLALIFIGFPLFMAFIASPVIGFGYMLFNPGTVVLLFQLSALIIVLSRW